MKEVPIKISPQTVVFSIQYSVVETKTEENNGFHGSVIRGNRGV